MDFMPVRAPRMLAAAALVLILAACAPPAPVKPKRPAPPDAAQMLAAIHRAGRSDDSAVQVTPMRDPAAQRLLDRAHADERAGHVPQAAAALEQALELNPKAPDLLQERAEIAVRQGHYAQAEQLARQSYALGPKLGPLCARNWQTVLEMRKLAGDDAAAGQARKQVAKCRKKGVVRL